MKKHGCLWWALIGWWWWPVRALLYDLPKLLIAGDRKKAQKPAAVKAPAPSVPARTPQTVQRPAPVRFKDAPGTTYKVTGISHRLDNLLQLAVENEDYHRGMRALLDDDLTETRIYEYEFYPLKAEVVPEPENPYDPNAIKVVVDGQHVGYIKAGSCAHLLRVIREGRLGTIRCAIGGGRFKYLNVEYDEDGNDSYDVGMSETPYFCHLKIEEL